jgi:predicted GIY-YIG superfamily endonuclease
MTVFVYVLRDPRSGNVRYVGQSIDPALRLRQHIRGRGVGFDRKSAWIRDVIEHGFMPVIQVVEETTAIDWPRIEGRWIERFRRRGVPLTNGTPGFGWSFRNHAGHPRRKEQSHAD